MKKVQQIFQVNSAITKSTIARLYSSISLDPITEEAQEWMDRGANHWSCGNYHGALQDFQSSIKVKGTSDAYFNVGNCYYMLKDFEKAANAYKRSISLNGNQEDVHVNLANILALHLNKKEDSLSFYKSAIALSPSDGEIRFNYAVVLDTLNKLEEAVEEYKMASKLGVDRAKENLRNALVRYHAQNKDAVKEEELKI